MALTIRTLSEEAERTLAEIMKNNDHINTSSKAIEYVLENYPIKCLSLEQEQTKNVKLSKKLEKAKDKLNAIVNGFGVITDMIAKKD